MSRIILGVIYPSPRKRDLLKLRYLMKTAHRRLFTKWRLFGLQDMQLQNLQLHSSKLKPKPWAFRKMECDGRFCRCICSGQSLGEVIQSAESAVWLTPESGVSYEQCYPETKRGIAGAVGRWDATVQNIVAYVQAKAEALGVSEVKVYKEIQLAKVGITQKTVSNWIAENGTNSIFGRICR